MPTHVIVARVVLLTARDRGGGRRGGVARTRRRGHHGNEQWRLGSASGATEVRVVVRGARAARVYTRPPRRGSVHDCASCFVRAMAHVVDLAAPHTKARAGLQTSCRVSPRVEQPHTSGRRRGHARCVGVVTIKPHAVRDTEASEDRKYRWLAPSKQGRVHKERVPAHCDLLFERPAHDLIPQSHWVQARSERNSDQEHRYLSEPAGDRALTGQGPLQ